jgi:putative two-component system response regulator
MTTPPAQRILVVDDDPFIGSLLLHGLTPEGFHVSVVQDGQEALTQVAREPPDLVLLDLELPSVPGDEVCRRLKSNPATQLIPIVMITAMGAFQNKLAAWHYGADDFLTKPFHMVEVSARCRSLLRIKRLIEERDSAEAVVFARARAVEAKSPYTHGHSERVTQLSLLLADAVGIGAGEREVLRKGALLHDIGKISIPDAILDKPGRLTEEEFAVIRAHPLTGAHIVDPLVSMREALPLIRWHHERLDGKGYPDRLAGQDIPRLVRILSVCDIYESLASDRPYRGSIPHARCLEILGDEAKGGGLGPELVEVFAGLLPSPPARAALEGRPLQVDPSLPPEIALCSLSRAKPVLPRRET